MNTRETAARLIRRHARSLSILESHDVEKPTSKEDSARKPSTKEDSSAPQQPATEVNVNVDAKPTTEAAESK